MRVRLVSVNTCPPTNTVVLHSLPVVVGRSLDADVRLADCWVSRHHCEIDEMEGTLVVRDLGSRHGTFVNGLPVPEKHLMPGDKLTVGLTSYRVDYKRRAVMQTHFETEQNLHAYRHAISEAAEECLHKSLCPTDCPRE